MGVPPDPNAQTAGTRVEELAQRLAHLDAQSQENARLRRSLEAEDRDLAERERDVEARIREARAGLARAQQMQPLHDLIGLARDCAASQGLLTLLDATIARDGSVVAWVTDGLPNYLSTSGRTWRISDFGEARRLWPHLPDQWREQRRRLEACGCQTVPADGLVSARELVGILERFLRPTAYRLTCVHHTHRDANAVDRYVVHTLDGTRSVPFATAGMAQRFLGQ